MRRIALCSIVMILSVPSYTGTSHASEARQRNQVLECVGAPQLTLRIHARLDDFETDPTSAALRYLESAVLVIHSDFFIDAQRRQRHHISDFK